MSESTQTLTRGDLKTALGEYLSLSRTTTDWTSENAADILRCIAIGQRQFYAPSYRPVPTAPLKVHVWSFLRANASISLSNGTQTYSLPDSFAGFLDGRLAFSSTKPWSLKLTSYDDVVEHVQDYGTGMPSGITQPLLGAVYSTTSTLGTTGQRWTLIVWPTPTSSLTLVGQYQLNPDVLSDDTYYPLGGAIHAETLLESCLAAAEAHFNEASTMHRERFAELLAQSIQLDLRLHAQEAA